MSRKLLTEVIGTFFLVLTIGLTVTAGLPLAPVAIGFALMAMVYMGGAVSGAHYNPAVTAAIWLRGKIGAVEAIEYMAALMAGSVLAALAVYGIAGKTFMPAPAPSASPAAVLAVEVLFTFALALVVLNVATARATEGNSYFGLAIGMTVMVGAFAGGPISGGAFNPAVGLGPALVTAAFGGGSIAHLWYYLAGPLAGGILAAAVFRVQNPAETVSVAVPFPTGLKQAEGEPAAAQQA